MEDVTKSLKALPSTINEQSISSFIRYIDNLNIALDGKMNFDAQGIIKDLKEEYEVCYETWYNKKKKELLSLDLSEVDDINETYDSFLYKQDLDFSFEENLNDLTFFGSSEEFDKYYMQFGKNKSFKVDRNIFIDIYETQKNQRQIEKNKEGSEIEKKLSELEEYFEKQKRNINKYFGTLNFYDQIDSKYLHCNIDIFTIDKLLKKKDELLDKLYYYYDKKRDGKEKDWESQINRAKYKSICQSQGILKCENGHRLNGESIECAGECEGALYWVDGPTHYCICIKCQKISKLEKTICKSCKGKALCIPKFVDYQP